MHLSYTLAGSGGDAPPLLLVPGLGMQSLDWPIGLLRRLGQGRTLILAEPRDGGLSPLCGPAQDPGAAIWTDALPAPFVARPRYSLLEMAADFLTLLARLGVARASILGFSMGGMLAQLVALLAPDRVAGLILIATAPGGLARFPSATAALLARSTRPQSPAEARQRLWREALYYAGSAYPADSRAARRHAALSVARSLRPGGTARQLRAILAAPGWGDALSRVACPALVVHGTQDPCLAFEGGRRLAAALPRASFWPVPGLGHDLPESLMAELAERGSF